MTTATERERHPPKLVVQYYQFLCQTFLKGCAREVNEFYAHLLSREANTGMAWILALGVSDEVLRKLTQQGREIVGDSPQLAENRAAWLLEEPTSILPPPCAGASCSWNLTTLEPIEVPLILRYARLSQENLLHVLSHLPPHSAQLAELIGLFSVSEETEDAAVEQLQRSPLLTQFNMSRCLNPECRVQRNLRRAKRALGLDRTSSSHPPSSSVASQVESGF